MSDIGEGLAACGLTLPATPVPSAHYRPYRVDGHWVVLAGQTCERDGRMVHAGKVGRDVTPEAARDGARVCMLNLLAALREAVDGDWSRVRRCVRVGGFVNCEPEFPDVPQVIDGASDLLIEVMGEAGWHARTAVGVATLPGRAAVEVEAIFALAAGR